MNIKIRNDRGDSQGTCTLAELFEVNPGLESEREEIETALRETGAHTLDMGAGGVFILTRIDAPEERP